jgi:hypothetical protein
VQLRGDGKAWRPDSGRWWQQNRTAVSDRTPCSGEHEHHGGDVQVLRDPDGRPPWVSPVEPGATHDLTIARAHTTCHRSTRLWCRVHRYWPPAGAGVRVPVRRPPGRQDLDRTTRGWNSCIDTGRACAEHGTAHLRTRRPALARVTSCPCCTPPQRKVCPCRATGVAPGPARSRTSSPRRRDRASHALASTSISSSRTRVGCALRPPSACTRTSSAQAGAPASEAQALATTSAAMSRSLRLEC